MQMGNALGMLSSSHPIPLVKKVAKVAHLLKCSILATLIADAAHASACAQLLVNRRKHLAHLRVDINRATDELVSWRRKVVVGDNLTA